MLSLGMFTDFASATTVRRRGLLPGSPPPVRAATVSSLMIRVKILPRLASSAPFLCLIECHLEWPDIRRLYGRSRQPCHPEKRDYLRARTTHVSARSSHARPS